MIKWAESYSTGIAKLDEQHKSLFRFCNDLEEGLNSQGVSRKTLVSALNFLERYAKGHFGQEETCMGQCACPFAENNKLAHHQFIEKYQAFQVKVNEEVDTDKMIRELHHFIESWLTDHIIKIDTKLKPYVHQ